MSSSYLSDSFPYENEDEEENLHEESAYSDAIMFAIDCSESMLTVTDGEIPVIVALKSVRSTILSKIASSPRDQIGVVLYATRESNNSAQKDHICVMCPLDVPDVPRIKELDALIQDVSMFKIMYGSTNFLFPIGDVFSVLSDAMSKAPKTSKKRVFLITNNDDPTGDNPVFKKTSIQRAKDLCADNTITLFGLDTAEKVFDTNKFYKDIASFGEEDFGTGTKTGQLTSLMDMVETSSKQPRSAFRIPFEIAPGLTIGVKGYNLVIEERIPHPKKFTTNAEKIEEVVVETSYRCVDTGKALATTDIKIGYEFGEEIIEFSKEDISKLKTVRDPSLLVLVFKKKTELKDYHQISHPYFIYPDDSSYIGSAKTFMVLLNTLLKKDQIGICSLVTRRNTIPRIVALVPQIEKTDPQGNQTQPPGFQLVKLPYADEIRPVPPVVTPVKVNDPAREAAKDLIRKYEIEYDPSKYHNPAILNHKIAVQNIALGRGPEEKPVDTLLPDYQYIEHNLTAVIDNFKNLVGLDGITIADLNDYAAPSGSKRKSAVGDDDSLLERKAKASHLNIPEMWKAGLLTNATNQLLKDFLTTKSIQPKKLKKDLITQIDEHLSKTEGK
ncbi:SPOC like C-terminal domain-containing protein [Mucor mucedo]|uniref:SPOC like C-terminal domain-containing protein n=1 Tax=Mucor mucedo TaxID=29922 RepID=UPI00221FCFF2|nr:SPOC like C-terminal domain-containing protein [Mucor mucedo]KAI7879836.1 SPOC like C-terminal domain-containing protein [Mucor mucedo]